jgi:hypothetical protein
MDGLQHAVARAEAEVESLVLERRLLLRAAAAAEELDLNERRLARAQRELSRLLVQKHRPRPAAA